MPFIPSFIHLFSAPQGRGAFGGSQEGAKQPKETSGSGRVEGRSGFESIDNRYFVILLMVFAPIFVSGSFYFYLLYFTFFV